MARSRHRRLWPPPGGNPRRAGRRARGVGTGRVIAVVQPHRFTRLRDLMDDFQAAFNDADMVYVAPVYPAGEQPIEGSTPPRWSPG
jgi:UDP-N-acetylmuramate-alanine ligase